MKQFLILVVVCALGYFFAPQVLGIKADSSHQYRNEVTYSKEDKKLYSVKPGQNNSKVCQTSFSIMLDLTEAENVKENTQLLSIKGNARSFGLLMTKDGLMGCWEGNPWGAEKTIPLSRLQNNENVISTRGADKLSLTVLVDGIPEQTKSQTPGVTLVDASGDVLLAYPPLNTVFNSSYQSVEFNERLISHVMITPKLLSVKGAAARARRLEKLASFKPGNAMVAFGGGGMLLLILAAAWAKAAAPQPKHADNSALKMQSLSSH